jgi:IS30 family transposase
MPGARLNQDEREEIALGLAVQRSFAAIARGLDRPTSTVAREVDRNGGARRYRATRAQRDTSRRARRPEVRRLVANLGERFSSGWNPTATGFWISSA